MLYNQKKFGDFYLQLYASSPAPKRDYHGLTITNTHAILNSWDITRGPHIYPRKKQISVENLSQDRLFRLEVKALFGVHVLEYMDRLADNDHSLFSLPEIIFRKIIRMLAVKDILHLRQTSKIFFEICNTNAVWKIMFQKSVKRPITSTELKQSETMSWQHMLKRRILEKADRKAVYRTFKEGVETLRRHDKKVAEKLRENLRHSESQYHSPPRKENLKFVEKKLTIKTYKLNDADKARIENDSKNYVRLNKQTVQNLHGIKTAQSEINLKKPKSGNDKVKTSADERPKSTIQLTQNKDNLKTDSLKISKTTKQAENLKVSKHKN